MLDPSKIIRPTKPKLSSSALQQKQQDLYTKLHSQLFNRAFAQYLQSQGWSLHDFINKPSFMRFGAIQQIEQEIAPKMHQAKKAIQQRSQA